MINYLIVNGNAYLCASYAHHANVIGTGMFLGDLIMNDYPNSINHYFIRNCTILGDGSILNDTNYFDTLKLSTGRTYTFGSNKSQHITNWFDCIGNPGFPIELISNNIGQQATLNIGQNMFCSDYLYLRDMNGTGSPNLYVGANSNNVYDNSGWIFSNCNVGINEISDNSTYIFPNPFSDETYIKSENNFNCATLILYNQLGKEIKIMKNISGQTLTFQRENIPSGVYFIRLKQYDKIILSDKLSIIDK